MSSSWWASAKSRRRGGFGEVVGVVARLCRRGGGPGPRRRGDVVWPGGSSCGPRPRRRGHVTRLGRRGCRLRFCRRGGGPGPCGRGDVVWPGSSGCGGRSSRRGGRRCRRCGSGRGRRLGGQGGGRQRCNGRRRCARRRCGRIAIDENGSRRARVRGGRGCRRRWERQTDGWARDDQPSGSARRQRLGSSRLPR